MSRVIQNPLNRLDESRFGDIHYLLHHADRCYKANEFNMAIQLWRMSLRIQPSNYQIYHSIAHTYFIKRMYVDCVRVVNEAFTTPMTSVFRQHFLRLKIKASYLRGDMVTALFLIHAELQHSNEHETAELHQILYDAVKRKDDLINVNDPLFGGFISIPGAGNGVRGSNFLFTDRSNEI